MNRCSEFEFFVSWIFFNMSCFTILTLFFISKLNMTVCKFSQMLRLPTNAMFHYQSSSFFGWFNDPKWITTFIMIARRFPLSSAALSGLLNLSPTTQDCFSGFRINYAPISQSLLQYNQPMHKVFSSLRCRLALSKVVWYFYLY